MNEFKNYLMRRYKMNDYHIAQIKLAIELAKKESLGYCNTINLKLETLEQLIKLLENKEV